MAVLTMTTTMDLGERAPWHRRQAVLHQLVGHVLALRPCQEAPDWLRFTWQVCTQFAPYLHYLCIQDFLVCTMFDLDRTSLHQFALFTYVGFFGLHRVYKMFAHHNKFTQFALSKLFGLFVYTKFTQVYTVCTKFALNLHRVYVITRLFSGEKGGLLNV
jgi:hypothetical protein